MIWAPLLPAAMVGTDRQSGPLPQWPGPIGALVTQAAQSSPSSGGPATGLLRAAAVLAPCLLAGVSGHDWPQALAAASPDDARPAAPATLHPLLHWALHEGLPGLHALVFHTLADAGYRLPPMLLPQALELGRRSVALRPALLAAMGERGLWLASQRDEWRYAAGAGGAGADQVPASHWTDGTLEQRRQFLRQERQSAPAAARARLEQALPELPAKERADLLAVLETGIGPEDEALLDRCRTDRSREVREAAVRLLMLLPESAFTRRAEARLATMLRHDGATGGWQLEAPAAAAPEWEADQITVSRPQNEPLGERAWWLYQLVRHVPLAWWTRHTGLAAEALLAWAVRGDWAEALTRGWFDALSVTREPQWCEVFLQPGQPMSPKSAQVLQWLPQERRERHWQRHVEEAQLPLAVLLSACLEGSTLGAPLSAAMTRLVLERAHSGKLKDDYGARPLLPEFCAVIHPGSLEAFASVATLQRDGETASHADTMTAVAQVAALRRAFLTLPRTPSRTS